MSLAPDLRILFRNIIPEQTLHMERNVANRSFVALVIMIFLLLLGAYLLLSDLIPEGQKPIRNIESTSESVRDGDISAWVNYQDPQYHFQLRHPESWAVSTSTNSAYTVSFTQPGNGYVLKITAYPKETYKKVLNQVEKESFSGLFPPLETSVALASEVKDPVYLNFSSPKNDYILSKGVVMGNNAVFELEASRPQGTTEIPSLFTFWLRSFTEI